MMIRGINHITLSVQDIEKSFTFYTHVLGLQPIAKFKCYTTVGCKPDEMGVGPYYAIPKLMKISGMTLDDIGLFEINEAFASQALYCTRELGIDLEKVNIHGGAIALGHPIAATGSVLIGTVLDELERRDLTTGLVTMCAAGGMAPAIVIERGNGKRRIVEEPRKPHFHRPQFFIHIRAARPVQHQRAAVVAAAALGGGADRSARSGRGAAADAAAAARR